MPETPAAQGMPASTATELQELGSYERQATSSVLESHQLEIDSQAEGKRIAAIHIVNLEVFADDTGWLTHLNSLHRTTLESVLRRELLLHPGDRYSEVLARETERILRNPSLSSFVVVLPVRAASAELVDLLVVTRDVWSLRSNSEFVHEDGSLSYLKVAAAENNLFGRRKHLSLIFEMDQSEYSVSTRWRDLNVFGSRLQLVVRPRLLFGRASDSFEGTESLTRLEYPLWSLASKWGAAINLSHKDWIVRNFDGNAIASYDSPSTDNVEDIAQAYRQNDFALRTEVRRSFGRDYKHSVALGHELLSTRPRLLATVANQGQVAEDFARDLFPRSERSSALSLGYDFFTPRFITYRNINGYDLPEVRRIGPNFTTELALALQPLGSERTFVRHALRLGYAFDYQQDAIADLALILARRFERGADKSLDSVDATYGADWFLASPMFSGHRLLAFGQARLRRDVEDNQLVRLGGQDDLRGYPVGHLTGRSFYRASLELRSQPRPLSFMRVGYVAFYDAGGAAPKPSQLDLHQDIGLGLKALIPQTGESLLFLYWALPFDRDLRRFPGRITLGLGKEI